MEKTYLGDGVYAEPGDFKGEIILTTSNGIEDTNIIHLDSHLLDSLIKFLQEFVAESIADAQSDLGGYESYT